MASEKNVSKKNQTVSFNVAEDEHIIKLEKLCECLNTSVYFGVTSKYAKYCIKTNGDNKYSRPPPSCSPNSFVKRLFPRKSCNGEWSKRDWDRVFNARINDEYMVVRDSRRNVVARKNIVRGDIVHLRRGQTVPADIRLISADPDLVVDNRIITGNKAESKGVTPTSSDCLISENMIFACTTILRGSCMGVVLATGDQTVFAELTQFATKVRYFKVDHNSSMSSISSSSIGSSMGQLSLPSSLDLSEGSSLSIAG